MKESPEQEAARMEQQKRRRQEGLFLEEEKGFIIKALELFRSEAGVQYGREVAKALQVVRYGLSHDVDVNSLRYVSEDVYPEEYKKIKIDVKYYKHFNNPSLFYDGTTIVAGFAGPEAAVGTNIMIAALKEDTLNFPDWSIGDCLLDAAGISLPAGEAIGKAKHLDDMRLDFKGEGRLNTFVTTVGDVLDKNNFQYFTDVNIDIIGEKFVHYRFDRQGNYYSDSNRMYSFKERAGVSGKDSADLTIITHTKDSVDSSNRVEFYY